MSWFRFHKNTKAVGANENQHFSVVGVAFWIISSSSNMHMIPANSAIAEQLHAIRRSDLIQLSGYLVAVHADDGWRWKSSLSRTDTGNGSCELVWVEKLQVE